MRCQARLSLALLPILLCLFAGCGRQRPWNVLLFTFDTTRADFLGCYGKASARTPHLDRLAAEGFLFEHAYASNPVTQPSHSTILTGLYPMAHGVRDNTFFHLPEERQTLAELLAAAGFATGAAVGGFPLTREFGTAQGFDFYDDDLTASSSDFRGRPAARQFNTWYDERPAGHVNDAILPWLRQRQGEPFFAWLHYWDPHEPHIALPPFGQLFANDPYQGEIAYADESLGVVLRELDELGELERTLIVMTADHGEGRQQHHEMTHAFLAYDTTIHVPLIVRVPERTGGRRIAQRVGTVDIVPTVLDLLGLAIPEEVQGRSLAPLMNEDSGPESSPQNRYPYYAESMSPRLSHGVGELRAFLVGPWKYIHGPRPELFHLADDPGEMKDLANQRPEERQRMEAALRRFLSDHASNAAGDAAYEASEETRRRLAALGYLSGGGEGQSTVTEELRSDGAAPQDRVGDINLQGRLRRELSAGNYRQAERTARRLLTLAPENSFYRASLAVALVGLGEFTAAADVVEEAEVLSPANLEQLLQVAGAVFEAGEQLRGLSLARRLVAVADTPESQVTLGQMLLETGDEAAFEEAMARVLELAPEHRGARLKLARTFKDRGELEKAEEELGLLLAVSPVDIEGLFVSAQLLRASGRGEAALERLERVLRLAPGACEAHLETVTLLAELGRRQNAATAAAAMRQTCRDGEMRARAAAAAEAASENPSP